MEVHDEGSDPIPPTVSWSDGVLRLIDQRELPGRLRMIECRDLAAVCDAIRSLAVRGAPALGATAAFGVALAVQQAHAEGRTGRALVDAARRAAARLEATRPTAVNLGRGAAAVVAALDAQLGANGADGRWSVALDAANSYARADVIRNRALGEHGAALLADGARVLTHCNAGALACVGYGTAIGIVRAAAESGKAVSVWVDETRPVLQGARITAWELERLAIPATVIADAAAGALMARGEVDAVIVGADRVAANGDVANKIGTYALAVLARYHAIPFIVAAPVETIDFSTSDGGAIVVEERAAGEVTHLSGVAVTAPGTAVRNPAFDVTPAALITTLVTERGVIHAPDAGRLAPLDCL